MRGGRDKVKVFLLVYALFSVLAIPLTLGVDNFFRAKPICSGVETEAAARLAVAHPYYNDGSGLILLDYYVYLRNGSDPIMSNKMLDLPDYYVIRTNLSGVVDVCVIKK
jgi:hypothetical protein